MFEKYRFESPRCFYSVVTLSACILLFMGFMLLPRTPLLVAIGVPTAQTRVSTIYQFFLWTARGIHHTTDVASVERTVYGNLVDLTDSGHLVIAWADGKKIVRSTVTIANVVIVDRGGARALVNSQGISNVKFEFYAENQVIAWINGFPLNVTLVETGLGVPEAHIKTSIVDRTFAAYYWRIIRG